MLLVSVVVVAFNHEKYIKQCLDGILAQQTTFPFEIVVGEDESSDNTRQICIDYKEKYPDKISLFLRSRKDVIYVNGNPTGRFNFIESLKACKGKYIALCDGDDYWTDPYKLQKQVEFLEQNPQYSICFTYSVKVDTEGKPLETISNLQQDVFTQYDFLMGKKFQTRTQTILFERQCLDVERIIRLNPKNRINGDTILKIQLTDNNKLGARLPICTAAYRIHQGGVWSSLNKVSLVKKSYYSWKGKLRIAFQLNKKAFFPILYRSMKLYFKWKIVAVYKIVNK